MFLFAGQKLAGCKFIYRPPKGTIQREQFIIWPRVVMIINDLERAVHYLAGRSDDKAFLFEDAYLFIRLCFPSTLLRSKTELFVTENKGC